jgi:hypothetical protein
MGKAATIAWMLPGGKVALVAMSNAELLSFAFSGQRSGGFSGLVCEDG